jgi:hypothetical protein
MHAYACLCVPLRPLCMLILAYVCLCVLMRAYACYVCLCVPVCAYACLFVLMRAYVRVLMRADVCVLMRAEVCAYACEVEVLMYSGARGRCRYQVEVSNWPVDYSVSTPCVCD